MNKKAFLLILLLIFFSKNSMAGIFVDTAEEKAQNKSATDFSLMAGIFRQSRTYMEQGELVSDWSFGATYNGWRIDYSTFYQDGKRITLNYHFMQDEAVTPYLGVSRIFDTNIFDKPTTENLDGYNAIVGVSLNYFRYVKPYVEYMPIDSLFIAGIRFHLPLSINFGD